MVERDVAQRGALPRRDKDAADSERRAPPFLDWRIEVPFVGPRFEIFSLASYLILITAYLSYLIESPWRGWPHLVLWTATFVVFLLSERWESWFLTRHRAVAYMALRVGIAAFAVWLSDVSFLSTFIFFIVVAQGWAISQRAGVTTMVMSAVAAYGVMFLIVGFNRPGAYVTLLPWLAGLGFMGGLTQLTKREHEARERSDTLLGELSAAHRQLQRYAEQAGELATTQERNRLAREIHDSLGHYLTIINVQLESAMALRSRDAERADRAVGEAKRLASEALADVRRSVAALRPSALDAVPIAQAIERQVSDFREHSGLAVDLTIEGDEGRCSQAAGLALYRAVQEGLTNIRKHAEASRVSIRLRFGPATTELTIGDDGRGLPAERSSTLRADGGGVGLAGLRERLNVLGGSLDVRAVPQGGTELVAMIPNRG